MKKTHNFKKILLLVLFLLSPSISFSVEKAQDPYFQTLKQLLKDSKQYEKGSYPAELYNTYSYLKKSLQNELYFGKDSEHLQNFLFLDGIMMENIESLQSLLFSAPEGYIKNTFQKNIDEHAAHLLSYAAKLNETAKKSEVNITIKSKKKCQLYRNNESVPSHFFQPAGVSFYLKTVCQDRQFAINFINMDGRDSEKQIQILHFKTASASEKGEQSNRTAEFDPKNLKQVSQMWKPQTDEKTISDSSESLKITSHNTSQKYRNRTTQWYLGGSLEYGKYQEKNFTGKHEALFFPSLGFRWKRLDVLFKASTFHLSKQEIVQSEGTHHRKKTVDVFTIGETELNYIAPPLNLTHNLRVNLLFGPSVSVNSCMQCSFSRIEFGSQIKGSLEYFLGPRYSLEAGPQIQFTFKKPFARYRKFGSFMKLSYHF